VVDGRGRFLAKAFWSERSQIALRVVTRDEEPVDDELLARRIAQAIALRERVFGGGEDARFVRLVHGEADLLPGLVADRYGDAAVIQTLVPWADRRKALLAELLAGALSLPTVVERNDVRVRELEGLPATVELLHGNVPDTVEVRLEDVRLIADLRGGQKTGAFLDQRENYRAAGALARGRVLDAFSFQGGFALHAARGAERVEAVEISAAAVRRGEEGVRLNRLENVSFVEANAFDYLHEMDARGERYDMVILDPPAFAKNRRALEAGLRGYKEINLRALRLLSPGGILVTCSCSHHVTPELFLDVIAAAAHDAGRACQVLERRGQSRDHPVLATCPETGYLKCVIARVP
jgi:23S rRNA (cytosine1962-C5)-methyltransferase